MSVLLILKPTRIHPALERAVAGRPAGEVDVHRLSKPRQALMWKSHTQFLKANPRSTEYMLKLAFDHLEANAPAADVDLLIDEESAAAIPEPLRRWLRIIHAVPEALLAAWPATAELASYTEVILLYRDGNGLSWSALERQVLARQPQRVLVLNGRRRVFPLTPERLRALRLRRFVETSWLGELAFAPAAVLAASALALVDAVSPRGDRRSGGR